MVKIFHTYLILSFFTFLNVEKVSAQLAGNFIEKSQEIFIPFTITNYGTKHGLPQNQIIDIIPKKNGELVLATANGIVQFNGSEFYDFIKNTDYKKNINQRIFWNEMETELFGLNYSGEIHQIYPVSKPYLKMCNFQIIDNEQYTIDFSGNIFKSKIGSKKLTKIFSTNIKNAHSFYLLDDIFYVSAGNEVFAFTKKGKKSLILNEPIYKIKVNPKNNELFFLGSKKAFRKKINGSITPIFFDNISNDFTINTIDFIDEKEFFIGTSIGLFYFAEYYTELYDKKGYLPSQNIQSLYYNEKEDCLFVGTSEKGLLKLHLKNCATFKRIDGISTSLNSIIRTSTGKILTAGSDNTIFQMVFEGLKPYFEVKFPIASLAEIDNELVFGTWGSGLYILNNQQIVDSVQAPRISSGYVHAIFKDSQGNVWVGTGNGISKGKTIRTIQQFFSKRINGRIISFFERRDGTICIGGKNGVFFIDKNGRFLKTIGEKDGLKAKEVRSFYEDREGKLWIGTYDGGLYCYFKNKLTSINSKKNCQLPNDIFTFARNKDGMFFITSNVGLWLIDEQKLNDFYYNKIPYLVPFYYGEESGILNTEFNGGFQNNFYLTESEHFYFPSIEGIVIVTPEKIKFRKLIPVFKNLKINDTIAPNGLSTFERTTTSIQFDFYTPTYLNKYNVYYQYKLVGKGFDDEWSKPQKDGTINFSLLPPGNYTFKIRCIDGFNDANPIVKSYSFVILPYFYETWWFYTFILLFLILSIALIIRIRTKRITKRQNEENKINNTILELKLKAIQAKMNPHFIFNSLNNVIYLLNSEKYDEAEDLLQNFSLLLRKFLEKSDHSFISLKSELDILQLYLAIEKKRYNNKFNFSINYPRELSEKLIPSMLIQPFVENAVKHGIAHKSTPSEIQIDIHLIHQLIVVVITDNGIGRDASLHINKNRKNHESKGIQLVENKIEIVRLKYNLKIELKIEDIYDGSEFGTRVILKIPLYD